MPYSDKEKQREYQRQWSANRRAKWLADKSCVECGSKDRLELDHINREEKVSHRIWSWSWVRIEEEAAKCQVLCKQCHQAKTALDLGYRTEDNWHGTETGWRHKGCRCAQCREYRKLWMRGYRARKNINASVSALSDTELKQ